MRKVFNSSLDENFDKAGRLGGMVWGPKLGGSVRLSRRTPEITPKRSAAENWMRSLLQLIENLNPLDIF
ncbi:hypothetical protein CW711_05615 [Candidatus Bathyarchaeota archaeon]|nr:MAG: hypothetical protein CW711_05615 [Candidatus Bathyarchaeota archaeon]